MFYYLSKIFGIFFNPICWILFICVLIIWKSPTTLIKRFAISIILINIIFGNGIFLNFILGKWEPPFKKVADLSETYDYAVILAGSIYRLSPAIKMYKQGKVKKLCVIGNPGRYAYKAALLQNGIPEADIFEEKKSKNTYQNAAYFKSFMSGIDRPIEDSNKIILITSATHMNRAAMCFKKQGINFTTFATQHKSTDIPLYLRDLNPSGQSIHYWEIMIKEWVGIFAYRVMGYL